MDAIRRLFRTLIPKSLYTIAAGLTDLAYVIVIEGKSTLNILNDTKPGIRKIVLKTVTHPFYFRANGKDKDLVIQNLIRNEYGKKLNLPIGDGFIIDAGAYIGDVSCYFASQYTCSIISLEPNKDSFKFALNNTAAYPQIKLLNKGLWYKTSKLIVKGEGTGSEIIESDSDVFDIDGISLTDLIKEYNINSIEILKLDIEGAEEVIFSKDISNWINIVKIILIEIHTEAGKELILEKLKQKNFKIVQYRSIYYCYNKTLLNSKA